MTRTDQLHNKLVDIATQHKMEISQLSHTGPKGGHNALYIPGWSRSTANVSRAAGLPMMKLWDGSAPTPSTAIPTCCYEEALAAEKEIFE